MAKKDKKKEYSFDDYWDLKNAHEQLLNDHEQLIADHEQLKKEVDANDIGRAREKEADEKYTDLWRRNYKLEGEHSRLEEAQKALEEKYTALAEEFKALKKEEQKFRDSQYALGVIKKVKKDKTLVEEIERLAYREKELLVYNNQEVERRRKAEATLKRHIIYNGLVDGPVMKAYMRMEQELKEAKDDLARSNKKA